MVKWLLIAALATIGTTALLIGVLYRANRPLSERAKQRQDGARDDGTGAHIAAGPMSVDRPTNADRSDDSAASDSASDAGGGDGGGGD